MRYLSFALLLSVSILTASDAYALDCTWVGGGGDNEWGTADNWDCDPLTPGIQPGVPGSGDSATVNSGGPSLAVSRTVQDFTFATSSILGLSGPGTLTVTGEFVWERGDIATDLTLAASGTGTIGASVVGELNNGATLLLLGDTEWTGGIDGRDGAVVDNRATMTATYNGTVVGDEGGTPEPVFVNSGTFRSDPVMSGQTIRVDFENTGTVEVLEGLLFLSRPVVSTGVFNVASGTELRFNNTTDLSAGTVNAADGSTVIIASTTTVSGSLQMAATSLLDVTGRLTLQGDETVPNVTLQTQSSLASLDGPGTLTVTGEFVWERGDIATDLTLAASGTGTIGASVVGELNNGATLLLLGDTEWTGGIDGRDGAVVDNRATMTATYNGTVVGDEGGTPEPVFVNSGTFRSDPVMSGQTIRVDFENTGTVEVLEGLLFLSRPVVSTGVFNVASGTELRFNNTTDLSADGLIGGSGTVTVASSSFNNEGTFAPGTSPGILTYSGDYDQTEPSASLAIELGGLTPGTEHDQLAVDGDAALGGTLRLSHLVGYTPDPGDSFTILTATGTVSGSFATVEVPSGYAYDVTYNAASVVVTVTDVPNIDLSATNTNPTGDPIEVARGGAIDFSYAITNNNAAPVSGDLWFTAMLGSNTVAEGVIQSGTVPAGGSTPVLSYTQQVPGNAPLATYTYTLNVGSYPNVVVDAEAFTVVVMPATQAAPPEDGLDWMVREVGLWNESARLGAAALEASAAQVADGDEEADETASETAEMDETASIAVPETFGLAAAYPNPFWSRTTLALAVPEPGRVTVAAYDALGRQVATLLDEEVEAATHRLVFDSTGLPSGVYLVRAVGAGTTAVQRITLVR